MKTLTEVCAARIRELEAKLQLADERIFFLAAELAKANADIARLQLKATNACIAWTDVNDQLSALTTDKERLDWLQGKCQTLGGVTLVRDIMLGLETSEELRAAIDAARNPAINSAKT